MKYDASNRKWFVVSKPRATAKLKLYCFSYAGGSASVYRNWAHFLPAEVEIVAVQLPGRETRFTESFIPTFTDLVTQVTNAISTHMDCPAAFFGHSMGALLAYEVACRLHQHGNDRHLKKLFVSGASAPYSRNLEPSLHQLPDDEFIDSLRDLNGTPQEILQNDELMAMFLPIIRADMQLIELHSQGSIISLPIPITAYGGADDEITVSQIQDWRACTSADFEMHMFAGDHFFIHSATQEVMAHLSLRLQKILRNCNYWSSPAQVLAVG